jgi:hypothetical protein
MGSPPSKRIALVCAAAALLLPGSAASAGIVFCNKIEHYVNVTIAYPQSDGSFISRGWLSLPPGKCAPFDTALRLHIVFFRGETERYRDAKGHWSREYWGKGRKFAMWENDNYQYYNAEQRVLNSTLAEFTATPDVKNGELSATVTFLESGSVTELQSK